MAEPQFFYRDDDSGDRKRVGKEIEKGGCKPILWETLEELKNGWHNGFVGGATDEQIKKRGKITSGAEDIKKQKDIAELECPLAILTNFEGFRRTEAAGATARPSRAPVSPHRATRRSGHYGNCRVGT